MKIERVSPMATRSTHQDVCVIDQTLISEKASDSRANARKREIHAFQATETEGLQRMLNAIQPGTYIRPHRHPAKVESLVLIQGALGFVTFEEDGTIVDDRMILLNRDNGNFGIDCRAGFWHTFIAMAPDTVVYEVKAGPFDAATDKEVPVWAPPENTSEGLSYLADLEARFRRRFPG